MITFLLCLLSNTRYTIWFPFIRNTCFIISIIGPAVAHHEMMINDRVSHHQANTVVTDVSSGIYVWLLLYFMFLNISAAILIHHISFRFISYRFESVRYFHNDVYLQHSDQWDGIQSFLQICDIEHTHSTPFEFKLESIKTVLPVPYPPIRGGFTFTYHSRSIEDISFVLTSDRTLFCFSETPLFSIFLKTCGVSFLQPSSSWCGASSHGLHSFMHWILIISFYLYVSHWIQQNTSFSTLTNLLTPAAHTTLTWIQVTHWHSAIARSFLQVLSANNRGSLRRQNPCDTRHHAPRLFLLRETGNSWHGRRWDPVGAKGKGPVFDNSGVASNVCVMAEWLESERS